MALLTYEQRAEWARLKLTQMEQEERLQYAYDCHVHNLASNISTAYAKVRKLQSQSTPPELLDRQLSFDEFKAYQAQCEEAAQAEAKLDVALEQLARHLKVRYEFQPGFLRRTRNFEQLRLYEQLLGIPQPSGED